MNSRPRALILLLACFLLPSESFGWGGDGHQITCLIAEGRLTPRAKAMIRDLLGDANISDAAVASWADNIRREKRSTGPWHYVNIPVDAKSFDESRDGDKGNNVIDKTNNFEKVLSDPKAPKVDRVDSLKFLVHFVGDLHQPLHCADRQDRGGNSRLVFFLDRQRAVSLHTVWDSTILLSRKGTIRSLDYARKLDAQITSDQATAWIKGAPQDWANESHMVAVNVAYKSVPTDGPPPKLDQRYFGRAADAIDLQLEKGGVRLAEILDMCAANLSRP